MEFVSKKLIKINRVLSDLDKFTLKFVRILRKHTEYVIISGYVSILLGRARASEDVDIIIPRMDEAHFSRFVEDLKKNGFECLNADKTEEISQNCKISTQHQNFSRQLYYPYGDPGKYECCYCNNAYTVI